MNKSLVAVCSSALLLLAACGGGGDDAPAAQENTAAPAPVTAAQTVECPGGGGVITGSIPNANMIVYAGDSGGDNYAALAVKAPADVKPGLKICIIKVTTLPAGAVGDVAYEIRGTDHFDAMTNRQIAMTVPTTGTLATNPTVHFYKLDGSGKATEGKLTSTPTFHAIAGRVVVTVEAGERGLYTVKLP